MNYQVRGNTKAYIVYVFMYKFLTLILKPIFSYYRVFIDITPVFTRPFKSTTILSKLCSPFQIQSSLVYKGDGFKT